MAQIRARPVDRELKRMLRRILQDPRGRKMVRESDRVGRWLQRAGLPLGSVRTFVAIDLVELMMAAEDIKHHARALLRQNPSTKRGARVAARHASFIQVILSSQLLPHVRRLNRNWEHGVEDPLHAKARRRKPSAAA